MLLLTLRCVYVNNIAVFIYFGDLCTCWIELRLSFEHEKGTKKVLICGKFEASFSDCVFQFSFSGYTVYISYKLISVLYCLLRLNINLFSFFYQKLFCSGFCIILISFLVSIFSNRLKKLVCLAKT